MMAKFFGGDGRGGAGRGSQYCWSIYWKFISESLYDSNQFLIFTQASILVLNIYHFFVRQNSFWRCFSNISPFSKNVQNTKTYKQDC
jgi:hypothetical protein